MKPLRMTMLILLIAMLLLSACAVPEEPAETLIPGTPISGASVPGTEESQKTIVVGKESPTPELETGPAPTAGPTAMPAANQEVGQELAGNQPYSPGQKPSEAELKAITDAQNQFALDLYQKLSEGEGNLFFSPYSLYSALTMTYAGAEGQTASEFEKTLHLPETKEKAHQMMSALKEALLTDAKSGDIELVKFTIANAVWAQLGYPFQPAYLNTLSANYDAGLSLLDYRKPEEAREIINRWVEEQTKGRILDLIPQGSLSADTRMVLTNAIYFKANWALPFKESKTVEVPFYLADGSNLSLETMNGQGRYAYLKNKEVQILELPYEGGNFSMLLVMPLDKSLADYEKQLKVDLAQSFDQEKKTAEIIISLPKLDMQASIDASELLKSLGMETAFEDSADFSGMTGSKDLKISKVVHKADLKVNESGTEAAAATGVVMGVTSAPMVQDLVELHFDHPFIMIIRDNKLNTNLFMGRFVEP